MKTLFIIILKIIIINSERFSSKYILSYLLSNNDVFLVLDSGIKVYDYTLTSSKYSHDFPSDRILSSAQDAESVAIAQFPKGNDNNNIILSLVKKILYVFTYDGDFKFEIDLSPYLQGIYYSLIAYKFDESLNYFYIITNFLNNQISIQYFKLTISPKTNTRLSYFENKPINSIDAYENIMYYGLSCNIMITSEIKEVISCFYQSTNPLEIGVASFDFNEENINYINNLRAYSFNERATVIKSATSEDKKNALVCFARGYDDGVCLTYNIAQNKFSDQTKYFNKCRGSGVGLNVYFFKEKNEYMFICSDNNKGYKMVTFDEDLVANVKGEDSLTIGNYAFGGACYEINTFSIIYIQGMNDYAIINDCKGNDNIISSGITRISNLLGGENNLPDEIGIRDYIGGEETNENTEETTNTNINNSEEILNTYHTIIPFGPTTIITNKETTIIIEDKEDLTIIIEDKMDSTIIIEEKESTIITEKKEESTIITEEKESTIITEEIYNNIISGKLSSIIENETEENKKDEKKSDKSNLSIIKEITNKEREEILNDLNSLIEDKESNKTYIIEGSDFTVIIKPINKYIEDSTVNIDFSECEKILRKENPSSDFIFLQVNMENTNKNCLTEQVEYKVYNEKKEEVDLSPCNNVEILIEYEIKNSSLLNLEEISNFKDKGIDIFNIKDKFFNDICYPYSDTESNSDMILKDRVSDIYQNFSLCGEECEYDSFNMEKMSANCNCKVKQEVNTELEKGNFETYIESAFLDSNFGVIKCFNLVFGLKGKLENSGFWIFGIMTIMHIPIYILYCINGVNPVKNYITKEMNNKGYEPKKSVINKNNRISYYNQETTNQKMENNKSIVRGETKKNSFHIIKKETENNPPKRKGNIKNEENNKIIKGRNKIVKVVKINSENLKKNNFMINSNDLNEDNVNKKERKYQKRSTNNIIKIIKLDKISEKSQDISFNNNYSKKILENESNSDLKSGSNVNEFIYPNKHTIQRRNRKLTKFSFKTFDIRKNKKHNQNPENIETINIDINKEKEKDMKYKDKRKFTIIKSNVEPVSPDSGDILNRNFVFNNNDINNINKDSEIKLIKHRNKNKILTKDTLSSIQSYRKNSENNINEKNEKDKEKDKEYPLIRINANNENDYFPLKSKYILDNYDYEEAIIYDKRHYLRLFFIFIISKDNLLNIIFFNPPLELKPLRFSIFIFSYACDIALNALFYLSDNISDRYQYEGENLLFFSIVNNMIISAISTLVSYFLILFFQSLTQSNEKIENIFREEENMLKNDKNYKVKETTKIKIENEILKILKCLKIKIFCFIILESVFMIFFFYYVTAFCDVYKSTQTSWLLDCVTSYFISLIITISVSIIFSALYKLSIIYKLKFLYKIVIFIYSFG